MAVRLLQLRYAATCAGCSASLAPRSMGWWESETKVVRCEACGAAPARDASTELPAPLPQPHEPAPTAEPVLAPMRMAPAAVERPSAQAGGSAQREYERRAAKHERDKAEVREKHPLIGGLIVRTMHEPQSTTAWAKGAAGERHLARHLDALSPKGAIALHDRRLPRSAANIDHIVVAPSGIWVVDAKNYRGRVEKRDRGGWLRSDVRLYVGRRDCTGLVAAMTRQVQAVRNIVGADVPIRPTLCFTHSDFPIYAMSFSMDGVMVSCVRSLKKAIARRGPLSGDDVARLASLIDEALPPAA